VTRFAIGDAEEFPLAGEVIDLEPITPPWPGWERLGTVIGGGAWQLEQHVRAVLAAARIILPPVLRCSAHLAWRLPANALLLLAAEYRRRRLA
jgi:hypothetical protein